MIKLYRAISLEEKADLDIDHKFRTSERSLEVKQFFKSREAVVSFVAYSVLQGYIPLNDFLLTINVNEDLLKLANPEDMVLDGFEAVSVKEQDLESFNISVIFIQSEQI